VGETKEKMGAKCDFKVVIGGGGITGLTLANMLQQPVSTWQQNIGPTRLVREDCGALPPCGIVQFS
jgi:NADH dehydrogenase FAD-containing subunit